MVPTPQALAHTGLASFMAMKGGHTFGPVVIATLVVMYKGLTAAEERKRTVEKHPAYQLPYVIRDPRVDTTANEESIFVYTQQTPMRRSASSGPSVK